MAPTIIVDEAFQIKGKFDRDIFIKHDISNFFVFPPLIFNNKIMIYNILIVNHHQLNVCS